MKEKVTDWFSQLRVLSEFSKSQLLAACASFCFGKQNKFSYFLRTIPEMNDLMQPVDKIVQNLLLPAISGEKFFAKERELYLFLVRSEGLGIII